MATEEQKALMAERVLSDAIFGDMIQDMKWQYFQEWMLSQETNEREQIHAKLLGLLGVQAELETLMQRHQINNQETDNE